jgi:hypothetical protein
MMSNRIVKIVKKVFALRKSGLRRCEVQSKLKLSTGQINRFWYDENVKKQISKLNRAAARTAATA